MGVPVLRAGAPPARVREELHAGQRIIVLDLTGMSAGALQPEIDRAVARIALEPPGSVLLATIVKEVRLGVGQGDQARAFSAAVRPHIRASAVVGLSAFSRAIFLMVRPFLHPSATTFDDLAAAKDWLVAQP